MASNLLKDMGNNIKGSLSKVENEGTSAAVESNGGKRNYQELTLKGLEKNDQNLSTVFKYDTGLNTKAQNQFSKALDARMPVPDAQQQQRSQPQQITSHPSFTQDMAMGKEFLPNYANLQQPMFAAASGYANGGTTFPGQMIPPMLMQQPMPLPANMPGMFQTGFMYPLPEAKSSYQKSHYFPAFSKGSLIMLSNGGLKPIEDLKTTDFIESAKVSKQLALETCTIAKIQEVPNSAITLIGFAVENYEKEVLVEKPSDHPFYIYNQGWASCKPDQTLVQYGLPCQQLKVGDVCVFLSDRPEGKSDKLTAYEGKSAVEDGVTRNPQASFGEANRLLTSQTSNGGEPLSRELQQSVNNITSELGYKKGSPFENVEKSDGDSAFGSPAVKKAKLDVLTSKNMQDGVAN